MTKILRKTISIKHNDEIAYCLTYNLEDDIVVKNLQWWINEKLKDNFSFLYRIQQLYVGIKANSKDDIIEKTLFEQLKYIGKFLLNADRFNTQRVSNLRKPYRNFVLLDQKEIDKKIDNYIN